MRMIYANGDTVEFSYDDENESIYGRAFVEMYSSNAFTIKFSKDTVITEKSKYIVDCIVHKDTIIGTGNRKYRFAILQAINEFKRGNHNE